MENTYEKIKYICNLIMSLGVTDIVCNVAAATVLQNGIEYKFTFSGVELAKDLEKGDTYTCGVIGDVNIHVDPLLRYDDTRVFDKSGILLIDFKEHGIENWNDFI